MRDDILLKGVDALAIVALIFAESNVELRTFSHRGVDRHHLQLCELVDSARVVFVVIHCQASRQVAFGRAVLDVGVACRRSHQT